MHVFEVVPLTTLSVLFITVSRLHGSVDLEWEPLGFLCGKTLSVSEYEVTSFVLKLYKFRREGSTGVCELTINATRNHRLLLSFSHISNSACKDSAQIFDANYSPLKALSPKVCTEYPPGNEFATTGSSARVTYTKLSPFLGSARFRILVTQFHEGACGKNEFRCLNGRCIDLLLNCSGHDNCGDNSNNFSCPDDFNFTTFLTVTCSLAGFALLVILVYGVWIKVLKRKIR